MANTTKEEITEALEKAKAEGKLRTEKIREIIQNAVAQAKLEVKEGSSEVKTLVTDSLSAVIDSYKGKGNELKDEITASIEGIIRGINSSKRQTIAQTQDEIKQLESQIDAEEIAIQKEVEVILDEVQQTSNQQPIEIKKTIDSVVENFKNSEELAILQKSYAQLKSQLAVLQANLAEKYGDQGGDVKKYLEEAKIWYEKTKENPDQFNSQIQQKQKEFEDKLSKAGSTVARKEQEIKHILQDLWKSISEIFQEKNTPKALPGEVEKQEPSDEPDLLK
ncbi:histidine kinase [Aphanothece hegewaldii CCALA 016]|uniref:Histidine kinase n=1 Tax=Aphanothece hegewaldii CCALA 016 TaxID=2107694 RepID=A0A2T1M005_9CHRO|nr:histidine kinase [Aphanothece hegewaldii]PSF37998.1 histidine kinase [Aphanothece hegewaldii CCALA 016]